MVHSEMQKSSAKLLGTCRNVLYFMQSYIISNILTANRINISKNSLHHNKLKYNKATASPHVCQNQTERTLCIEKAKDANLLISSTLQLFPNIYLKM